MSIFCVYVRTYEYMCSVEFRVLYNPLGLTEVGIFRLPGSTTRVNELKELFNEGIAHMLCMYV